MLVVRRLDDLLPERLPRVVLTIGNFDGCHVGHQAIFRRVRDHAKRMGGTSVAITFDPHPASIIKGITPQLIFTPDEKARAIESLGMDCLVVVPFTREFAETEPEVFVRDVLVRGLQACGVVVGHDFSFGKKALGDIAFLKRMGAKMGFFVESIDPVKREGTVISSSFIRRLIQEGRVKEASDLMIHPFRMTGTVVHGMSRGRSMGFPTANIQPVKALIPAYGVYAVYADIHGRRYKAVANIGNNPTFGDGNTSIETFIFDFKDDLYGQEITIEFVDFIRGEIKFPDRRYLMEQIERDCARAVEILGGGSPA